MTCQELVEHLLDFVANELEAEHRQRLEQHLQHCPHCVTYVETYRLTIQITRRLTCKPLPPQFEQRLRVVLRTELPPAPPNP